MSFAPCLNFQAGRTKFRRALRICDSCVFNAVLARRAGKPVRGDNENLRLLNRAVFDVVLSR